MAIQQTDKGTVVDSELSYRCPNWDCPKIFALLAACLMHAPECDKAYRLHRKWRLKSTEPDSKEAARSAATIAVVANALKDK